MSIDLSCPNCGRVIYAPSARAGQTIVCPGCGRALERNGAASQPPLSEEPVQVACPQCQAPLRVVARLVGRHVVCNACHTGLLVSLTVIKAGARSATGTVAASDPFADIAAGDPATRVICLCGKRLNAPASFAGQTAKCPNCGSTVRFPGPNGQEPSAPHGIQEPHFPANHKDASQYVEALADECPPLSPKEVSLELRDRKIRTVLHMLATGEQVAEDEEPPPAPGQAVNRPHSPPPLTATPPWFWPLTVATAATCIMVIMLGVITLMP